MVSPWISLSCFTNGNLGGLGVGSEGIMKRTRGRDGIARFTGEPGWRQERTAGFSKHFLQDPHRLEHAEHLAPNPPRTEILRIPCEHRVAKVGAAEQPLAVTASCETSRP